VFPIQDSVPSRSVPVVTRALILINAVAFFFELGLSEYGLEQVFYLFGIVPARFTHPDWAVSVGFPAESYVSLFTHQFLHGGWLHIISNMWTLWIFGDNVEDRMGPVRFAIFYLACGVVAALTQVLSSPNSTVPSVGASGAIAGGARRILFVISDCATGRHVSGFVFPILFRDAGGVLFGIVVFNSVVQRSVCVGRARGGRGDRVVGTYRRIFGWNLVVRAFCAAAPSAADATR
jgi:membrane associated rhomboid family serine protease